MENTFYIKICFVNIVFVFLAWVALRCPSLAVRMFGFVRLLRTEYMAFCTRLSETRR